MKRQLFSMIAATGLVMLSLTGCASDQSKVDAKPAPGSPDIGATAPIFADLKLAGHSLTPFNEDESTQLRQQVDLAGDLVRELKNPNRLKFAPAGSGCQAMMRNSFNLPMLHWSSLAAPASDGQAAAQVFLAPSEQDVQSMIDDLNTMVRDCEEVTVSAPTGTVKMTIKANDPAVSCPAVYRQTVTSNQVSQTLDVCYVPQGNAVLALSLVDSTDTAPDIAQDFQDFSSRFYARLAPLYTE